MSRVIYSIETLIVNTISVSGYAGSIHIRGIFFVVFIDADFNSCLWISKITEFIVLVRVWWWWRCVCLGGRGEGDGWCKDLNVHRRGVTKIEQLRTRREGGVHILLILWEGNNWMSPIYHFVTTRLFLVM